MTTGTTRRVTGSVVVADGMLGVRMQEVVRIGAEGLLGEVIRLEGDTATIQVYEDTLGLKVGEPVEATGDALMVELGPGLLASVYDGVQRPLPQIAAQCGDFIARGAVAPALDRERLWRFSPAVSAGDVVGPGDVVGTVPEGATIVHRVLVPPLARGGKVAEVVSAGEYTVEHVVARLEDGTELRMMQRWPVRTPRPVGARLNPSRPLTTGTRALDSLFPVALGGNAVIAGGFGTGKTIVQQVLAKWAEADIVVYVGCGERGNEMTEILTEFPRLEDPYHASPLMDRTVLIANTSNMPVVAREASVYAGATIAEYYRDMGYNVALMADSTSRWGEALREVSGRLEEMPGEEGYPAYLAARLAAFYERSGRVVPLGVGHGDSDSAREGSVTIIGAISPAGGDLSEPMTQNSLRVVGTFWALDTALAQSRHFPAISWTKSYTLSLGMMAQWYRETVADDWLVLHDRTLTLLQKEAELLEIVQFVGPDALPESGKLDLAVARMIREDFLQQSAYDEVDAFCPLTKQYWLLKTILTFAQAAGEALARGVGIADILATPTIKGVFALKNTPHDEAITTMQHLVGRIAEELGALGVSGHEQR